MARYSDRERAEALAVLDACKGDFSKAARATGVPRSTLQEWAAGKVSADVPEIRQGKKSDLADELEEVARLLVGALKDKIEGARLQDVAVALGVSVDKMRLLRGEATSITEDVSTARDSLYGRLAQLAARSGEDGVPAKPN